jgi:hypothetical protein
VVPLELHFVQVVESQLKFLLPWMVCATLRLISPHVSPLWASCATAGIARRLRVDTARITIAATEKTELRIANSDSQSENRMFFDDFSRPASEQNCSHPKFFNAEVRELALAQQEPQSSDIRAALRLLRVRANSRHRC